MKKLIHTVIIVGIVVQAISYIAIFMVPPATAAISPLICPKEATLGTEGSPVYDRNIVFVCIEKTGKTTDAGDSLFRFMCFDIVLPYIGVVGVLIAIYLVKKIIQKMI